MKKFNSLFSIAVFSALFAIFNSTDVSAAAFPSSAITIDYDNQKLIIKESGSQPDMQVYLAVPTIKNKKIKNASGALVSSKVMEASSWDTYDYDNAGGLTIDLSWLNRKKDNFIQLKGDKNSEPITLKFPAVTTKVSASFDTATAVVTMNDTTIKNKPVSITDPIEYRTQYSSWNTYTDKEDLSIYQVRGATLYFRQSAHQNETLNTTCPAPVDTDMVHSDGDKIQVYEAGSLPGTELKVSIKKHAAAPKFTTDYNKHQFNLPKNTEYRIISGSKMSNWIPIGDVSKKINLSDLSANISGYSAILQVRTAATSTKPCSSVSTLAFDMPAELTVHALNGNTPEEILKSDVIYNSIGADADYWDLAVAYVYKEATKQYTGLKFYNMTPDTDEVFVSKNGEVPTSSSKVYTIKAKSPASTNEAVTYIVAKNVGIGDKIYVRKKADVKNKEWSSNFIGVGTVAFDPSIHATLPSGQ